MTQHLATVALVCLSSALYSIAAIVVGVRKRRDYSLGQSLYHDGVGLSICWPIAMQRGWLAAAADARRVAR